MYDNEINLLREKLHKAIDESQDNSTILRLSQELDEYIVKHMKFNIVRDIEKAMTKAQESSKTI